MQKSSKESEKWVEWIIRILGLADIYSTNRLRKCEQSHFQLVLQNQEEKILHVMFLRFPRIVTVKKLIFGIILNDF